MFCATFLDRQSLLLAKWAKKRRSWIARGVMALPDDLKETKAVLSYTYVNS